MRPGRSAPAARPGQTATYAYCVVQSARPPDVRTAPRGLPGTGKPRAVAAGDELWLIVADAPLSRYGETALARVVRDLDAVSRCAVAHSAVVAHCARRGPVLPLRLLTLFSSDERALAQVRRRRRAIQHRLTHVAGRAEWGVQARLEAEGGQRARRARAATRRETGGLSPGTRFLELRRRQRHETHELAADARTAAASLYRALVRYADDARQRPPVSVDGRAALLLDAFFLVAGTRTARFRRAVRAHAARVADRGLRVRLTGPWPPYSFVAGRL
jgi:Gas vesicle synthesis protein GvpL/GvpF